MEYLMENRLTLETLRTELDMNDRQRVNAMSVLPLLERLGLIAWYDGEQHGLVIGTAENGPVDESLPLWIQEGGETNNVVAMLRMLCVLRGVNPDEDRVATLEKRVAALEKELRRAERTASSDKEKDPRPQMAADEAPTVQAKRKARKAKEKPEQPDGAQPADEPAAGLEGESGQPAEPALKKKPGRKPRIPEQIMAIYRGLEPSFTVNGVEFKINEEGKSVWYLDPRTDRPAIVYQACAEDLRKVRNLLKAVKKRTTTKAA